ncbi:MAG TPA: hypothetical protein VHR16_01670 [Candidatus Limnocylindrales bacterium]|jgi:hypothetical protein|nr:hypothetical protein [Candidatus Limnocylindrales bacterium]
MSKATVTTLFIAAALATVVGIVVAIVAILGALAGGAVVLGGPNVVTVNGAAFAGTLAWLIVAGLAMAAGTVAAVASWVGALLNTVQLEDKTWFILLLVLGIVSLGWVAMVAYLVAGPDATRPGAVRAGAPLSAG